MNKIIFYYVIQFLILINLPIISADIWQQSNQKTRFETFRSLSQGYATDGNNKTNANVLELMKVGLLDGYAIRRIKMFNDRIYLSRYRKSYWFGTRYYAIDNRYFLETRDTCAYRMNARERENLEYEENSEEPILDVIYQCQRYVQYCCGLDCCQNVNRRWTTDEVKKEFQLPQFRNYAISRYNYTKLFHFALIIIVTIIDLHK